MSKLLRVRPGIRAAVYVASYNSMVALTPGDVYDADDPVVLEHSWAFQRDAEVEAASAAPGERRAR